MFSIITNFDACETKASQIIVTSSNFGASKIFIVTPRHLNRLSRMNLSPMNNVFLYFLWFFYRTISDVVYKNRC